MRFSRESQNLLSPILQFSPIHLFFLFFQTPKHLPFLTISFTMSFTIFCAIIPAVFPGEILAQNGSGAKVNVCASCYPLQYFAERIGNGNVNVYCPVPEKSDPNFWIPDRETISLMQKADLILVNGANYEQWLTRVTLPVSRLVNTTKFFCNDLIRFPGVITHSHGPMGMHSHEGIDPHTWLDPRSAMHQAKAIQNALSKLVPDHSSDFATGFASLTADLEQLDAGLKSLATRLKEKTLLCSHPAYYYLARTYGWDLVTRPFDPDQLPETKDLDELKSLRTSHPAHWILWESTPRPELLKAFADIGIRSVVFSPCEVLTKEELAGGLDYLKVMNANLERLKAITEQD